jgi:uncharacterized protein (TIGR00251 family)
MPIAIPPWLHVFSDHLSMDVVVSPRSSRTRVMGVHDNRLKLQLAAPPVEGRANEELVRFVADTLGVAKAQVEIVGGGTSRRKTVKLEGVNAQLVVLKLSPIVG